MTEQRLVRISKYLSKHLRHSPEQIGLTLEEGGWVKVNDLLAACAANRMPITQELLDEVVDQNNKQRFSFNDDRTRIRANQGHSVEIDLQLKPQKPPKMLYHGTGHQNVDAILREGLNKRNRHHVHLSPDAETATNVGARHGRPVVLTVDAEAMHDAGYLFFCSANGVWLVDEVPPTFLTIKQ